MRRCIEIARRSAGYVSPNPMVGAVVLSDGEIIAEGYHKFFGGPHAEVEALRNLSSEQLENAVLYISLEPCCFEGKTPPCTELILSKGVKKVVVGMLDPNPKVNGKGVKILRDAGVNVEVGLLEHQCREINFGYIKRMEKGLPGVMCKIAISLDGRIGTSTKDSRWITGKAARIYAHKLRAEFDAILIGVGTVLADDPMLNVRHIEGNQPLRVIMDSNLRTPLTAKILQNQSNTPTVIFISEQVEDDRIAGFIKLGAKVEKTALDKEGNLSIVEILKHLSVLGVTNIMVEGGAAIFTSFLKEKLVDRLNVVIAPKLIGSDGIPAIKELGISKMSDVEEWNFRTVKRMGEDVLLEIVLNGK